jgi:hypothetical protein
MPSVLFYPLACALIVFGVWRIRFSRRADPRRRGSHRMWGVIYILVGAWLLGTQLGIIPQPHWGR